MESNKITLQDAIIDRPVIPAGTHILELDDYLIPTNEIRRLFSAVGEWIEDRSPGGIIHGNQRLGKTQAVEHLCERIPLKYGNDLPVFFIPARHKKNANEEAFYEMLLERVGHAFPFSGKKNQKFERLARFLLEKGENSNRKMIVMFIDEAQFLNESHYNWLIDLYNWLQQYRIRLIVMLVGQPELKHQKDLYVEEGKRQVVGRFMVNDFEFVGAKSINDIQICLKGYDNKEYPEDSGWSFTRYYYPVAFAKGNRLETCALELYEAFVYVRKEKNIGGKLEIPMQYLTNTVKYALLKYGIEGKEKDRKPWPDKEVWIKCVERSHFAESEISFIVPSITNTGTK